MTHNDLVQSIAKRLNWTQEKVSEALSATVDILNEKISDGNLVSISKFGVFDTIKTNEHILQDIDKEEKILFPPKIEVVFKPSSVLKNDFQNLQHG